MKLATLLKSTSLSFILLLTLTTAGVFASDDNINNDEEITQNEEDENQDNE